jgi:Bacterial Na+/H+ antiporter B (NhaB)
MYRYSQTLPGGPVTLVGILALSLLIPGWAANVLGFSAANAQVVSWIFMHQGIFFIALLLLYGLGGFFMMVGAGIAVCVAYCVLSRILVAVRNWAVRTSVAAAHLLWTLLSWPVRMIGDLVKDQIHSRTALWRERQELWRLYREEYTQDFPSYRAFLRHWRALQAAEQAKTDPMQQAIRLMGLTEPFTREDLKDRYHILIAGTHPDLVGPNGLGPQVIAANALICERKRWK